MSKIEHMVCAFSNKELKDLVIAYKRYTDERGPFNSVLLATLCEAYHKSCELESEVISKPIVANPNAPMGSAEYKLYEAMYESDVRAHS